MKKRDSLWIDKAGVTISPQLVRWYLSSPSSPTNALAYYTGVYCINLCNIAHVKRPSSRSFATWLLSRLLQTTSPPLLTLSRKTPSFFHLCWPTCIGSLQDHPQTPNPVIHVQISLWNLQQRTSWGWRTGTCSEAANSWVAICVGKLGQVPRAVFTSDGLGVCTWTGMESCWNGRPLEGRMPCFYTEDRDLWCCVEAWPVPIKPVARTLKGARGSLDLRTCKWIVQLNQRQS